MPTILEYYIAGGLTTIVVAIFVLLIPALDMIALRPRTDATKLVLDHKIIVGIIFVLLTFLVWPFLLVPIFSESNKKAFIEAFVKEILSK